MRNSHLKDFLIIAVLLTVFLAINAAIFFLDNNEVKKANCIHLEVGKPIPPVVQHTNKRYIYKDVAGGVLCEDGDLSPAKPITD